MHKKLILIGLIAVGGLNAVNADILDVRQAREEMLTAKGTMLEAKRLAKIYDDYKDDAIANYDRACDRYKAAKRLSETQNHTTRSSTRAHNSRASVYFPSGKPQAGITRYKANSNPYYSERGEF